MRKNRLIEFKDYAEELVARHTRAAEKTIGWAYGIGEGLILAVPPVRNGFLHAVEQGRASWNLLVDAYAHDQLPFFVSLGYIASAAAIGKGRFALGHAGYCIGATALTAALAVQGDVATAVAVVPTIIGGGIGAGYKYMERKWGNHENFYVRNTLGSPKKMTGYWFALSSLSMAVTAVLDKVWPIVVTGSLCLVGNVGSMLLPKDEDPSRPTNLSSQDRSMPLHSR